MDIKRFLPILLILILLFVSCAQEMTGTGDVVLTLSEEKALTVTNIDNVAYYRYTAENLSRNITVEGEVEDSSLNVTGGTVTLPSLAQGEWTFNVKAYNVRGKLLYEGSTKAYIKAGPNSITIVLVQHTGNMGHVSVSIQAIETTPGGAALIIGYKKYGDAVGSDYSSWIKTSADGRTTYSGLFSLEEGRYLVTAYLVDALGDGNSGISAQESIDMVVVADDTVTISGVMSPAEDSDTSILVTGPAEIKGHIEASEAPTKGKQITYTWVNEGDAASLFAWFLDGTLKQAGSSTAYKCTINDYGSHEIACMVTNADKEAGYAVYRALIPAPNFTPIGGVIVYDRGASYGEYVFDELGEQYCKVSGTSWRYLVAGPVLLGSGNLAKPYIRWAPYKNSAWNSSNLATSAVAGTGEVNLQKMQTVDGNVSSVLESSLYYISAVSKVSIYNLNNEGEGWFIPTYDEMRNYITSKVGNGLDIPAGSYWSSTEGSNKSTAWSMVVTSNGTITVRHSAVPKTNAANLLLVRHI